MTGDAVIYSSADANRFFNLQQSGYSPGRGERNTRPEEIERAPKTLAKQNAMLTD